MKASKGEWRAERNGDTWQVVSTLPDGSEMAVATIDVARPGFTSPLDAADAKLMAASKDLLAALEAAEEWMGGNVPANSWGLRDRDADGERVDALVLVRAAIAKAGGK